MSRKPRRLPASRKGYTGFAHRGVWEVNYSAFTDGPPGIVVFIRHPGVDVEMFNAWMLPRTGFEFNPHATHGEWICYLWRGSLRDVELTDKDKREIDEMTRRVLEKALKFCLPEVDVPFDDLLERL